MSGNCEPLLGSTLTENSRQDKPWTVHKRSAVKVSGIYASAGSPKYVRYSDRIDQCASYLEFSEIEEHDRKLKLSKAHFCRVRHCPICSWRRTLALIARFYAHLPEYLEEYPDYAYLYVVLTVKNPVMADLRDTIKVMNDALKKLFKRDEVERVVKGFVKTIEVTRGQDGNPHPHINLLLAVNKSYFTHRTYLKQARWVELWRESLKVDYDPVVHVSRVKKRKKDAENSEGESQQADLVSGVKEVVKYSVKEADLVDDPDFLIGLTEQVAGLRFTSTGGCLKGVLSKVASSGDDDEVSEQEMLLQGDKDDDAASIRQFYLWGYDDSRFGQYYLRKRFKKRE